MANAIFSRIQKSHNRVYQIILFKQIPFLDDEDEGEIDPALQKSEPEKNQNRSLPIEKSPSPVKQPKRSPKIMSPVKEKSPSPVKKVESPVEKAESPVQSPGPALDPSTPTESPEKKQDTPPR